MSPFFIALTLTDVLLLTLLVALPVRVWWWAKLLAIVVVFSFNFLAWTSADSGQGWPVRAPLPDPAQFVACQVVEPDIATHTVGAIYVWMVPLNFHHGVLSYRPAGSEPRAYAEPYDRSLHEACVTASKAAQAGVQTSIHRSHTHHHGTHGQSSGGRYHAYRLPAPVLPRKN
jgi:hypothetical protein